MKKALVAIAVILFLVSAARADVLDGALGDQATEQVRASTREMIRIGMPEDDSLRFTREMIQHRYQDREILAAHTIVREMVREGLPGRAAMDKALEGMAKQVRAQDTIRAMEQVRSRYSHAYRQAGEITGQGPASASLGDIMAEGMAAGMTEADVEAIKLRLQDRQRSMTRDEIHRLSHESFMAAREMVRRGAGGRAASEVVCQALQQAYGAGDMQRLRLSFMHQSRTGDPAGLAAQYAAQIRSGAGAEGLGRTGSGSGSQNSMGGSGQQGGGGSSGSGSGGSSGSGSGPGGGQGGSGPGKGGRGGS